MATGWQAETESEGRKEKQAGRWAGIPWQHSRHSRRATQPHHVPRLEDLDKRQRAHRRHAARLQAVAGLTQTVSGAWSQRLLIATLCKEQGQPLPTDHLPRATARTSWPSTAHASSCAAAQRALPCQGSTSTHWRLPTCSAPEGQWGGEAGVHEECLPAGTCHQLLCCSFQPNHHHQHSPPPQLSQPSSHPASRRPTQLQIRSCRTGVRKEARRQGGEGGGCGAPRRAQGQSFACGGSSELTWSPAYTITRTFAASSSGSTAHGKRSGGWASSAGLVAGGGCLWLLSSRTDAAWLVPQAGQAAVPPPHQSICYSTQQPVDSAASRPHLCRSCGPSRSSCPRACAGRRTVANWGG